MTCQTELLEIEMFLNLTVCKQNYLNQWLAVCNQKTLIMLN